MPPSGMRLARISIDHAAVGEALEDTARRRATYRSSRVRTSVSMSPRRPSAPLLGVEAQRSRRGRRPTRVSSGGRSRISPNCRFQQISCMSLVEHRDALAHVVERGLQDFAVVVDRGVGVVEQLQRCAWSTPCACAAAATAPAATMPRRSPRPADARHSAAAGSRLPPWARRLMRRVAGESFERRSGCAPRRDSGPRSWSVRSTVTDERHSRKLGAIGARSVGTNTSACIRSIGAGSRPSEKPILG